MKTDAIAFLCQPYHRGGVTSWTYEAAKECMAAHVHTYFVTPQPKRPFISGGERPLMFDWLTPIANELLQIPIFRVNYQFELGTDLFRAASYANLVWNNVPKGTPLILADDNAIWIAGAMLADEYPIIGVLHADDPYYFHLANQFHEQVSVFVSVSERIKKKAKEVAPQIPHFVIPCGIDLYPYKIEYKLNQIHHLAWVGRLEEEQKRVSDILPIAIGLKKANVPFRLSIAGHGPESARLSLKIVEMGLGENVFLLGWQNAAQIQKLLAEADVLVQTSNFEGMSVAVMEALASGCRVLSTRVSGVEDLDGLPEAKEVLHLYSIGDTSEAIGLLTLMLAEPKAKYAKRARALAEQRFSIQACMDAYRSLPLDQLVQVLPYKMPSQIHLVLSRILATLRRAKYFLKTGR